MIFVIITMFVTNLAAANPVTNEDLENFAKNNKVKLAYNKYVNMYGDKVKDAVLVFARGDSKISLDVTYAGYQLTSEQKNGHLYNWLYVKYTVPYKTDRMAKTIDVVCDDNVIFHYNVNAHAGNKSTDYYNKYDSWRTYEVFSEDLFYDDMLPMQQIKALTITTWDGYVYVIVQSDYKADRKKISNGAYKLAALCNMYGKMRD